MGSGFNQPIGVAVDVKGNVYVADNGNNAVKEIPFGSNTVVTLGSGFNFTTGVAVDVMGNVFVSDGGNNAVKEIPIGGGSPIIIGSGFSIPYGVAVDAADNIYVSDAGNNLVKQIAPVGGYYLGTPLPAGLSFNGVTGVLSGTPTVLSPAANYTVTAYNTGGGTPAKVNIKVSLNNNASLASLSVSAGTLSPAFLSATTSYTETVSNATASITITPTTSDAAATVKVNGTAVTSGTASGAIPLALGINTISTVVTAQDGTTTQTYTITVTRAQSAVAYLSNLTVHTATLSPAFAFKTFAYTSTVPGTTTSVTVTPSLLDASATVTVNGTAVASKTASGPITLAPGSNIINIVVTAADGTTMQTYTVTITRPASTTATLSSLKISAGTLSPVFATATTSYTASVAGTVASVTITPTATISGSTVTVNGTAVVSGTASGAISLNTGANTINVVVTAQDGVTKKTYTLIVGQGSNNAYLSNLKATTATLSPTFAFKTLAYTASVPNTTTSVTVTANLLDATASSLKVNGTVVVNKTASGPIALLAGPNTINIVIIAQDGVTKITYTITITRAPSSNDNLSDLSLSAGTLSPVFAGGTTSYTAAAGSVASIKVTPTTADPTATITVNGTAVVSGTASGPIALNTGANIVNVIVTAQDGVTKQTYTLTVGEGSNGAYLSNLKVTTATLLPTFAFKTLAYSSPVPNTTTSVTVTPNLLDATASSLTVNGMAVASKTASGPIALAVGANNINVVIIAQDGVTTVTYTITITRAAAGMDAYIPIAIGTGISVTKPTETPGLAEDGVLVHQGVSPNGDGINDFLQIDNISLYPDNKLMIMNRNGQLVYEAKGYDNSSKVFDGHSNKNGQMQLPGTYFYQLDYTVSGFTKHKTGFIVLKY